MAFSPRKMFSQCPRPIGANPIGDDTFFPLGLPRWQLLEWMYKWDTWAMTLTATPLTLDPPSGIAIDSNGLGVISSGNPPLQKRVCDKTVIVGGGDTQYDYFVIPLCLVNPGPNQTSWAGGAFSNVTFGPPPPSNEYVISAGTVVVVTFNFSNILYDPVNDLYYPFIEVFGHSDMFVIEQNNDGVNCLAPIDYYAMIWDVSYSGGAMIDVEIDGLVFQVSVSSGPSTPLLGGISKITLTPDAAF